MNEGRKAVARFLLMRVQYEFPNALAAGNQAV
jgi:hypothetical protein